MITYKSSKLGLKVLLEGKIVGEIRSVEGGYQYFPKGQKEGGEVFASIFLVKHSIEFE